MKKADVYSLKGLKVGSIALPSQFEEEVRADLIKRAVLASQSHNYQPYGANPMAGKRQGYHTSKRRRAFKTTYGFGISRVRRKHLWRRGGRFGWVAAFVANAVGGRKAFPPQADKNLASKINKKERRKAVRSAIAASNSIIIEDKIESLAKTKEVMQVLEKVKLQDELKRSKVKKIRAGKGTKGGIKYRRKKGPLLVVSNDCNLLRSARNLAGVDAVEVKNLNVELLAPGTNPGRTTVWSKGSVETLSKEGLFAK